MTGCEIGTSTTSFVTESGGSSPLQRRHCGRGRLAVAFAALAKPRAARKRSIAPALLLDSPLFTDGAAIANVHRHCDSLRVISLQHVLAHALSLPALEIATREAAAPEKATMLTATKREYTRGALEARLQCFPVDRLDRKHFFLRQFHEELGRLSEQSVKSAPACALASWLRICMLAALRGTARHTGRKTKCPARNHVSWALGEYTLSAPSSVAPKWRQIPSSSVISTNTHPSWLRRS